MQAQEQPMQPLSLCFLLEGVDVTTPLLRDSIHHDGKNGAPSVQQELHAYLEECVAAGKLDTFGGPYAGARTDAGGQCDPRRGERCFTGGNAQGGRSASPGYVYHCGASAGALS